MHLIEPVSFSLSWMNCMVATSDSPLSAGLGEGGTARCAYRVIAIPLKRLIASQFLICMITSPLDVRFKDRNLLRLRFCAGHRQLRSSQTEKKDSYCGRPANPA